MKVLLAPDSFKGALSANAASAAMERGLRRVWPEAECVRLPIADGGEGTLETLIAATRGEIFTAIVTGPMGSPVSADWGILGDGDTAVVELAQAAGLTLVPEYECDPKLASTFGVGELILAAAQRPGVRRLLIGLGGSATNDGGAGLLQAVGVGLLDSSGQPIGHGGAALSTLRSAIRENLPAAIAHFEVHIACDVDSPLIGPRGASAVFGPQKGASPDDIAVLDAALAHFASVLGVDPDVAGTGAAGGTTLGLKWLFPNAELHPGIELVLDAIRFDHHLKGADLVLTGEGRIDSQTLGGKAVAGVARRANAAGVPVGALVGSIGSDLSLDRLLRETGIATVMPLAPGPCTLEESVRNTEVWLADTAERAAQWISLSPGPEGLGLRAFRQEGVPPTGLVTFAAA